MTADQFAIWLQGYLGTHVFQWNAAAVHIGRAFDVGQVGADVLAAAQSVPLALPSEKVTEGAGTP